MNTSKLEKKVAIITGGTGYIGSEIAKVLSENGMRIAVIYNSSSDEKVRATLDTLHGDDHKAYRCDLKGVSNIEDVISKIESDLGKIYAFIHSAGEKPKRKLLHVSTTEDMEEQIQGNLLTSFNFVTAAAKKLKVEKTGVLIAITTIGVVLPTETKSLGTYIPIKYAIQGMMTMLKEEMSVYGVSVYSIAPGFMEGGMNSSIPKAFVQMVKEKSKMKKITSAHEIADVTLKLCLQDFSAHNELTIPVAPEHGIV